MFGTSTKRGTRTVAVAAPLLIQIRQIGWIRRKRSALLVHRKRSFCTRLQEEAAGPATRAEGSGSRTSYGTSATEERVVLPGRLRSIAAPPPPVGPARDDPSPVGELAHRSGRSVRRRLEATLVLPRPAAKTISALKRQAAALPVADGYARLIWLMFFLSGSRLGCAPRWANPTPRAAVAFLGTDRIEVLRFTEGDVAPLRHAGYVRPADGGPHGGPRRPR